MTTCKRLKVQEAAATHIEAQSDRDEHSHLVSDLFRVLTQCTSSHLLKLLPILLNASSLSTLQQVEHEATKIGAKVASHSVFQHASPKVVLDRAFSFLDMHDLRAAETTCSSWRAACMQHGAGWRHWLHRQCTDAIWHGELVRHRIRPQTLHCIDYLELRQASTAIQRTVAQMPWLDDLVLDLPDDIPLQDVARLLRGPSICRLTIISRSTFEALRLVPSTAARLTSVRLEMHPAPQEMELLGDNLRNLTRLEFVTLKETSGRWTSHHFAPLTKLTKLTTLEMRVQARYGDVLDITPCALAELAKLSSLTRLIMDACYIVETKSTGACCAALAPLARLPSLTHLGLGPVFGYRGDPMNSGLGFLFKTDTVTNLAATLVELDDMNGRFQVSCLEYLAGLPNLAVLGLDPEPDDAPCQLDVLRIVLSKLTKLTQLSMHRSVVARDEDESKRATSDTTFVVRRAFLYDCCQTRNGPNRAIGSM